jgi:hypothetical protein
MKAPPPPPAPPILTAAFVETEEPAPPPPPAPHNFAITIFGVNDVGFVQVLAPVDVNV